MGMADLQYIGNVANPEWNGCPPEALEHLGYTGIRIGSGRNMNNQLPTSNCPLPRRGRICQ